MHVLINITKKCINTLRELYYIQNIIYKCQEIHNLFYNEFLYLIFEIVLFAGLINKSIDTTALFAALINKSIHTTELFAGLINKSIHTTVLFAGKLPC